MFRTDTAEESDCSRRNNESRFGHIRRGEIMARRPATRPHPQTNRPARAFLSRRRSIKSREEERIRSPFAAGDDDDDDVPRRRGEGGDGEYKRKGAKETGLYPRWGDREGGVVVVDTELIRVNFVRGASSTVARA